MSHTIRTRRSGATETPEAEPFKEISYSCSHCTKTYKTRPRLSKHAEHCSNQVGLQTVTPPSPVLGKREREHEVLRPAEPQPLIIKVPASAVVQQQVPAPVEQLLPVSQLEAAQLIEVPVVQHAPEPQAERVALIEHAVVPPRFGAQVLSAFHAVERLRAEKVRVVQSWAAEDEAREKARSEEDAARAKRRVDYLSSHDKKMVSHMLHFGQVTISDVKAQLQRDAADK